MIDEFDLLFNQCNGAFNEDRGWKVGRDLAFGALTCMGRHTVTGMITASGKQFMDWSTSYRLFSQKRVDTAKLFEVVRSGVLQELESEQMIIAHMDDTILKKTGTHVPGTAWRRDPLGPKFQTNLVWGQRFVQISLALPEKEGCSRSRAIPVDFHHCPSVKKIRKTASEQDRKTHQEQKRKFNLSQQGNERLKCLRDGLDEQGARERQLVVSVDGSYTNATVLKKLPERVTLIGRIRKDTKLYALPEQQSAGGRKRVYGGRLPTPEQIRQSDQHPWQEVNAWAAGKEHTFKVKVLKNIRWRSAGQKHTLQLVIIQPLAYRLSKSSSLLYRDPAYLICTDNELDIAQLLQAYLWRWEIEVNFHEEKSLLGCGQAQVRNPESAERVPAFISAIYAMLNLAAFRSSHSKDQTLLPRPKWYPKKEDSRHSTGDLINNLRAQCWAKFNGQSFSGFVNQEKNNRSLRNATNPFVSAVFYPRN